MVPPPLGMPCPGPPWSGLPVAPGPPPRWSLRSSSDDICPFPLRSLCTYWLPLCLSLVSACASPPPGAGSAAAPSGWVSALWVCEVPSASAFPRDSRSGGVVAVQILSQHGSDRARVHLAVFAAARCCRGRTILKGLVVTWASPSMRVPAP